MPVIPCLVYAGLIVLASAASLHPYNVDPDTVSISGFSSGGFMAAQLGIAYSDTFKLGFGVFAGGPYDCARNQPNASCMFNNTPSITTPTANLISWSGREIDDIANLKDRRIYIQTGILDDTVGPNVVAQLRSQLSSFVTRSHTKYIDTPDAGHTFPTDFDGPGNVPCNISLKPYISNCGYDGAGAALQWIYGYLNPRNTGTLAGQIISFDQQADYGAIGMGDTAYLYVPAACEDGTTPCKLHIALHGCFQSYGLIQDKFVQNTGYNQWADTNNIIIVYPQTTVDNSVHTIWDGVEHSNPYACWDWIGLYGDNVDQKGGVQMQAIVNQVKQITSGHPQSYKVAPFGHDDPFSFSVLTSSD
ncbi:Alpha/Beta hydrolase protein [Aspergillus californicus]